MRSWAILVTTTGFLAVFGAADHAGGWNDGSRLATIECLVDYGTWAIDDSVFLTSRPFGPQSARFPRGTLDRMSIGGRYYSDKSPVPAILMAGPYAVWRGLGGPAAAASPEIFCRWMTAISSGLAYVLAAACLFALARRRGMGEWASLGMTLAFATGTLLLPYCRYVNNHILLAGLTAGLLLALECRYWLLAGGFAGLGYATDLGAGPPIAAVTLVYVMWTTRGRGWGFLIGLFPWVGLHHVLNYHIGGTIGPANANAEFFHWPGCPFDPATLSGGWSHSSPMRFLGYAIDLLFGKKGFYGHNPALFLLLPAFGLVLRDGLGRLALIWMAVVWLVYAAGSRNQSGECISIRWFVPLVVPGFLGVVTLMRGRPEWRAAFVWLSVCGLCINAMAFVSGPWAAKVPGFWPIVAVALLGAIVLRPRLVRAPVSTHLARAA